MASLPYPPLRIAFRSIFLVVIVWIGVCCFSEDSADGYGGELLGNGGQEQREFDLFKLALQWPGTYCRKSRKCCPTNGCCRGSNGPAGFTIHGLWPDYSDGSWPSCCNGKRFDSKEISTLSDAMNKYWPSLSCGSSSNCHGRKGSFWEHEWEKHGTCASAVTGDEYKYFLTALNLYFKYNVTDVLRESGYVASNSEKYPVGGIIESIQNAFHATPEVECSGGAIEELHLCFYKDLTPRDCESAGKTSCPTYVSLPEYAPLNLGSHEAEAWSI